MKFHAGMTLEKFYLDWFGNEGRELGSNKPHPFGTNPKGHELSHRQFTQSHKEYLEFIKWCKENQTACWITSQPMREYNLPFGIEKLFFDFDYPLKKNWNMTKARREKVKKQVLEFIDLLDYEPLLVATRKGYHAYVFLRRTYEFNPRNLKFAKEVFGVLGLSLLGMPKLYSQLTEKDRKKWKYLDFSPLGDINRMARVPLTPHEKTGLPCQILNRNLEPTKIRSLDLYRGYGLREDEIRKAVETVKTYHKKNIAREEKRIKNGANDFKENGRRFKGEIRPCFIERLQLGEMVHQQRLALLVEAYWSGIKEEEALVDLFREFKDFNEQKTRYQVRYFLKHDPTKYPPYRCKTLEAHGWCLKSECPLYKP